MKILALVFAAAGLLGAASARAQSSSDATETKVMVRAVAQDAKILHDAVGGARITIRDASTGEVLAKGIQRGSSGSTEEIMRAPRERGAAVYDTPEAAGFLATLALDAPTPVEITAEGPLGYPHALQRTTTTMLLVPGEDVLGDGVVLTLRGFIVEVLAPDRPSGVAPGGTLDVRARVRMLCGCPTEPGGLWDADAMTIEARLVQDGTVLERAPLAFTGEASTYAGTLSVPEATRADTLTLQVLAADADRVNFGRARRPLPLGTASAADAQ